MVFPVLITVVGRVRFFFDKQKIESSVNMSYSGNQRASLRPKGLRSSYSVSKSTRNHSKHSLFDNVSATFCETSSVLAENMQLLFYEEIRNINFKPI